MKKIVVFLGVVFLLAVFVGADEPKLVVHGEMTEGSVLTASVDGIGDEYEVVYEWTVGKKHYDGDSYTVKAEDFYKGSVVAATCAELGLKLYAEVPLGKSSLPVVYINTDDGKQITSRSTYVGASMKILLSDDTSEYENSYTESFGVIEIRGRGNSTWGQGKKPYKIKLDEKADLFGMGANKHWVLLANALDRSHLRNKLSYDLSGELGLIFVESVYVEVIFNGEYAGVYQLCENIRISKNRVDIFDWEDTAEDVAAAIGEKEKLVPAMVKALENALKQDLSWITSGEFKGYRIDDYYDTSDFDISGGYLIEDDAYFDEVSKFRTDYDMKLMIKSPEYAATNNDMMDYLKNYIREMENALYSLSRYNDQGKHYSEYMDLVSFVDFWMVNQAFKNVELLFKSCYMYKDVGDVIRFGPVWDFDWTSGNHMVLNPVSAAYNAWYHGESQDREYWYRGLYSDPYFVVLLQDRWWDIHPLIEDMIESMDGYYEYLKEPVDRDNSRWGKGGGWSFEKEVTELKSWLENRMEWMDEQLLLRDPNIMNMGVKLSELIKISVSDENGTPLPADTVSSFNTKADFYYPGTESVSVEIDVPKATQGADLFVNGILYKNLEVKDGKASVVINSHELLRESDRHRNVFTVLIYGADKSVSAVNYCTLAVKGAPSATVTYLSGNENAYGVLTPIITEEGVTITLAYNSYRLDGHSFVGWSDGENTYRPGDTYKITEDITFTAVWKEKKLSGAGTAAIVIISAAVIAGATFFATRRFKYYHIS